MEGTTDNKKKIIFLGGIIAAIVVLVIILLVMVLGGSSNIYVKYFDEATKIIDEAFDEASKVTDEDFSKVGATGKASVELDLNDNLLDEETKKIQEMVNGLEVTYEVKVDEEEKFIGLVLAALKDNEELISAEAIALENKGYVKIKDVMDKYYETDLEEDLEFETDTKDLEIINDVEIIYEIAKKQIRKQLNSDNIDKENDEIRIDGEKVKVKKHTLTITQEIAYETALAILDQIVNKEEALQAMTNIYNMEAYYEYDIEEVEEELTSAMDDLKAELEAIQKADEDEEDYSEDLAINVYTKGFKNSIVKVEMGTVYDDEFEEAFALSVTEKEDKKVEYVLESYDEEVLKATVQDKGKDVYNVEVEFIEEELKLVYDGVITDEKIDGTYEISVEDEKIKGTIFLEAKKDTTSMKFSIEADELGKIGINLEMTTIDKFDIPDVSDSTTTIDETEVQEKLMNKLTDISDKLGIDLEALMESADDDYYDDYYYDDSYLDDYYYDDTYDYNFDDFNSTDTSDTSASSEFIY